MSYTFSGATGDDINWGAGGSGGATNTFVFVAGWWLPTTLTTGLGLWSFGAIFGAEVDSTNDEVRLKTDNTTDGQWTTAGVDMAVDQWQFIAFLNTCLNAGASAAWRVWSGTIESAPVEATVSSAVSPSGNFTGSNAFVLGNKGVNGNVAWAGDVGSHLMAASDGNNPFTIQTSGAISDAEALFVYEHIVLPFWLGDPMPQQLRSFNANNSHAVAKFLNLDMALPVTIDINAAATDPFTVPALNGVTFSQNRTPRPYQSIPSQPWHGASRR